MNIGRSSESKSLKEVEKKYGRRPRIPMGHSEPLKNHHFRAELDNGQRFVYCPIGALISWSDGDYLHYYCPWCKGYFNMVV